jgi:Zinc finger, C3HC4 type (RING finger)
MDFQMEFKVQKKPEDKEDKVLNCLICLHDTNKIYTTKCKHIFCKSCIMQIRDLFGCSFPCPWCSNELYVEKLEIEIPLYHPDNYPTDHMLTDPALISAYETISKEHKWEVLHDYVVDETRGFMLCDDVQIRRLMNKINDDYAGGHSGVSMGLTMRQMHFIAQFGLEKYHQMINIHKHQIA